MNFDGLSDLLKSRECETLLYFHTDHFEPWSTNIDEPSARAVERMAELARASRYARKLSLFYSVFIPYKLDRVEDPAGDGPRVPGDDVVFVPRSDGQEELARQVIAPLVCSDQHEMHLHVHHEYWTRNTSNFENVVSQWVNRHSTSDADRHRLDLNFQLCKETIARETGMPFERWAFIHGNWALNASDPLICDVDDEIAIIMRHGGFGDFTFPAGRSYCDPKMERPFTCVPVDAPRAYDDERSDARPIGSATGVMQPNRFFIWNSPIKSNFSSLDYYSKPNRDLLAATERVLEQWIGKSVALGGKLFLKTHAHSMKGEYNLTEPDSVIPHRYPDVETLFDTLSRICDRARVEFRPVTVNEVMTVLRGIDGDGHADLPQQQIVASSAIDRVPPIPISEKSEPIGGSDPAKTFVKPGRRVLRARFVADGGLGWTLKLSPAFLEHTDNDDFPQWSRLELWEDDKPLGPPHALHRSIREIGRGHYSFWKSDLYFSTSDGSNPNTNGRTYSIVGLDMVDETLSSGEPATAPSATALESIDTTATDRLFPLRGRDGLLFSVYGNKRLQNCPVCHSRETMPLWRIPMTTLGEPISVFGGYFNQVPTLEIPGQVFCFDFCRDCESIFLNPVWGEQKQQYRMTDHYVRKMSTPAEWQEYEDSYDVFAKWIPAGATVLLDAACGIGQYLHVARRCSPHRWRRLIGLELADAYVRHMREAGLEGYDFDVDEDDLSSVVEPNSVDFVLFCEAFEHVERPLDALRKLVAALAPGGRLFFTAQRYGADSKAAVRPGEPIYIGDRLVRELSERLGYGVVDVSTSAMRYYIVLEK